MKVFTKEAQMGEQDIAKLSSIEQHLLRVGFINHRDWSHWQYAGGPLLSLNAAIILASHLYPSSNMREDRERLHAASTSDTDVQFSQRLLFRYQRGETMFEDVTTSKTWFGFDRSEFINGEVLTDEQRGRLEGLMRSGWTHVPAINMWQVNSSALLSTNNMFALHDMLCSLLNKDAQYQFQRYLASEPVVWTEEAPRVQAAFEEIYTRLQAAGWESGPQGLWRHLELSGFWHTQIADAIEKDYDIWTNHDSGQPQYAEQIRKWEFKDGLWYEPVEGGHSETGITHRTLFWKLHESWQSPSYEFLENISSMEGAVDQLRQIVVDEQTKAHHDRATAEALKATAALATAPLSPEEVAEHIGQTHSV